MKAIAHDLQHDHSLDDHDLEHAAPPVAGPIHRKAHGGPSGGQSIEPAGQRSGFLDAINAGLVLRHGNGEVNEHASTLVSRAAAGSGHALPDSLRGQFEQSLGADLSAVRVHTGGAAQEASEAVGARAYAVGQDVFMGAGEYAPNSTQGAWLLAHEVAHTVQQRGGSSGMQTKLQVSEPGDAMEHEADRAADAMMSGAPAMIGGAAPTMARQVDPAAAARSCSQRGMALRQIATISDLATLREIHDRLTAVSRGNPDDMVVAEAGASFQMTRRDLWAVVQAVDTRVQQIDASMRLPSTQGPSRGDGPVSSEGAAAAPIANGPRHVEMPENPVAEGLEHAGHVAHNAETGADALYTAGSAAVEAAPSTLTAIGEHGLAAGLRHGAMHAGAHIVMHIPFALASTVLFGSLIFAMSHTAYSEFEFPATVDQRHGGTITQNARGFSAAISAVLRGQAATGAHAAEATAIANQQIASLMASSQTSRQQVMANLREQPNLAQQVFDAVAPSFRAATDSRAAELVRDNHRPEGETTILANMLRSRVEAARP